MDNRSDLIELVSRLARLAYARDRTTDRDMRTITITDDEAVILLDELTRP
jgi:hypothetical protein